MEDRRRFLKVIGGSVLALGVVPIAEGCGDSVATGGTGGGGGAGGGGAGGASSSSQASSSSVASSSSTVASSSSGPPCGVGESVGMPSLYMTDGLHKVTMPSGTKVLIGHDAGGFYALSSLCTHQFCDLNTKGTVSAAGVACACHGSRFDNLGNVVQGPAVKPLPAFAMSVGCDGTLYVDTATKVDNMTRFMP